MTTQLEQKIAYAFKNKTLLQDALTHPSALTRRKNAATPYERLEFLGDRVLGLIMANWLFEAYPDDAEGLLARHHAALVRRETLAAIAIDIDLPAHIQRAADDSGRGDSTILGDALEALLGAMFLDGGLQTAEVFVRHFFANAVAAQNTAPRDPKTALQEWAQARGFGVPHYEITERTGPSHAPEFTITVTVKNKPPANGTGTSKQLAEKAAAAALLLIVDK